LDDRIGTIFSRIGAVVPALERLTGVSEHALSAAVAAQQH
jgi:hypothetical protein